MLSKVLVPYLLPVFGLKNGIHTYHFLIDELFFKEFENGIISNGKVEMDVVLDKRQDMMVFEFTFEGIIEAECDRCLVPINLPIKGNNKLIVKYSETVKEDDGEVVFVDPNVNSFSIAQYAYEFILLAVPILRRFDCASDQNPPCDMEMLQRLKEQVIEEDTSPAWDVLKGLSDN